MKNNMPQDKIKKLGSSAFRYSSLGGLIAFAGVVSAWALIYYFPLYVFFGCGVFGVFAIAATILFVIGLFKFGQCLLAIWMRPAKCTGFCYPYLAGRQRPEINHDDNEIANVAMAVIEYSFGIADEQKGLLRPTDDLLDLYRSWYNNSPFQLFDDMELEQVEIYLSDLAGEKITLSNYKIGDIIDRLDEINRRNNGIVLDHWQQMRKDFAME